MNNIFWTWNQDHLFMRLGMFSEDIMTTGISCKAVVACNKFVEETYLIQSDPTSKP